MQLLDAFGIDYKIIIANLINFSILLLILYKIGYKPIVKFVKDRTENIEQGVKNAEEAKKMLSAAQTEQEKVLAEARKEAQDIIGKAKEQAEKQGQNILEASKADAARVVDQAKRTIREQHDKMVHDAKQEVATMVVQASEKLLREKVDSPADQQFIQKTLAEMQ